MKNKIIKLCGFSYYYVKLIIAWLMLHIFNRNLLKKEIWIVREKRDEARDNGYHFYKYIRENHPEINAFYVITPNSSDKYKVEKYGNLIDADSWKHCVYFLAAVLSINSQLYGAYPFHFTARELKFVQKLCNPKQKVVFLQHGIIKDKFALKELSYGMCNIDYFVTSAAKEYEFVKEVYGYPNHSIGCLGLARFDYLHTAHVVEDKVLVMPTWRKWLGNKEKTEVFRNSEYYAAYATLLSDEQIIQYLREKKYKLVFYMHYKLQPHVDLFKSFENDVVIIASKEDYDVQELLMTSKLMITDYSSVYFDFAYMNKPLLYYQFDVEQFRKGHYAEGYFSYEKNGFGPCLYNLHDVKHYLFEMMEGQCAQPEKYKYRVEDFFDLRDNHNCERIYQAIKTLE